MQAEDTSVASGDTQEPSGTNEQPEVRPNPQDKVEYSTYKKVLGEKKRRDEELASVRAKLTELENQNKAAEEQRLAEAQEWKKLAELRQKELEDANQKIELQRTQELNAKKLDSFLTTLDGKVDRKYWDHIDFERISVDPTTGEVDELSVTKAVETFRQSYPEIIAPKNPQSNIPNNYPQGSSTALTYETWKTLPLKEKKSRYQEMLATKLNKK